MMVRLKTPTSVTKHGKPAWKQLTFVHLDSLDACAHIFGGWITRTCWCLRLNGLCNINLGRDFAGCTCWTKNRST